MVSKNVIDNLPVNYFFPEHFLLKYFFEKDINHERTPKKRIFDTFNPLIPPPSMSSIYSSELFFSPNMNNLFWLHLPRT